MNDRFRTDVLAGLRGSPKSIPPKYFYDRTGSLLFDAICDVPEYYVTRAELSILESKAPQLVASWGARVRLVEPGAGSGTKTRLVLDALGPSRCSAYVPVDIAREHLEGATRRLRADLPWLEVTPVCSDFVEAFTVPPAEERASTVVYFPGSTIGNFHGSDARRLLARFGSVAGRDGAVVLGVDLKKDPALLHAAYNDAAGVTAAFNKNLLVRMNRELGGDFEPEAFAHYAFFEPLAGRVEMHLVSKRRQVATVAGERFSFGDGESIRTECSYKFDLPSAVRLATSAGLELADAWLDDERRFAVLLLRPILG